jgi:8-oxo-dGTP diphosphatase
MAYTHSNVVGTIIQDDKGRVLLFKRRNTKRYPFTYCLPCGRVDKGNTLKYAAARETLEEVNISINEKDLDLHMVVDRPNWPDSEAARVMEFFFKAKAWQGNPQNNEPEKHEDPAWYSLDNLPEPLHVYTKEALGFLDSNKIIFKTYE